MSFENLKLVRTEQLKCSALMTVEENGKSTREITAAMFNHILTANDAFFKLQSRNEADLTIDEKRRILEELYEKKKATFLQRYHRYLTIEDIDAFDANDFECAHYIKLVRERLETPTRRRRASEDESPSTSTAPKHQRVKQEARNRRYNAMKRLIKEGEYFSDWDMRQRAPLLYDQMVGQYMTDEELKTAFQHGEHCRATISAMFMDFCESRLMADRLEEERAEESLRACSMNQANNDADGTLQQAKIDSEDSSSEYDSDDELRAGLPKPLKEKKPREPTAVDSEEKARLREEYVAIMQERFIDGQDAEFVNYNEIDNDERNDDLYLINRDCEDEYFDSESPAAAPDVEQEN